MNFNPAIQVRVASGDDLPQADRLLWDVLWRPVGLARDIRERFKLSGYEIVLVAVDARGVVGVIVGQTVSAGKLEIRHLAVTQDYQHKGVGSALIVRLLDRCREMAIKTACTHARNTSQAFFERHGFEAVPGETLTHPDFARHGISFQLMQLALSSQH
jgi:N-acetylglutamate synthase-like GNAT family acetyltransferase